MSTDNGHALSDASVKTDNQKKKKDITQSGLMTLIEESAGLVLYHDFHTGSRREQIWLTKLVIVTVTFALRNTTSTSEAQFL